MSKFDFDGLKPLVLVTQLGLIIGINTVLGVFLGRWLDSRLETNGLLVIIFVIFGLSTGLWSAYRLLKKTMG